MMQILRLINLEWTIPITNVHNQKWFNIGTNSCILHVYTNLESHLLATFGPQRSPRISHKFCKLSFVVGHQECL